MKNFLKYWMVAGAVMAISGSVYATQTIYITDGAGIGGVANFATSSSGAVTETISGVDGWSIVVGNGTASPPAGSQPAQFPSLNLTITANYSGGAGSILDIYFGSDGFGPTSTSFTAALNGHTITGTGLPINYDTWDVSGSGVPSVANPIPVGANPLTSSGPINISGINYTSTIIGGPVNLASYSLGQHVTLTGSPSGTSYSVDESLATVPEPTMTALAIFGATGALGFGMMRRRK
jgi:hypothetical protein